jgi:threonine dehydrogenase-like Zn-dependent dehydrogenase
MIVDTTGNSAVLTSALVMADHQGTVLLLGDTGHPGEQRLSSAVPIKGLSIVGVHDRQTISGWEDRPRIFRYVLDLMARRRFDARDLITHRYIPDQAAEAYAIANESRGQTVGIAFTWS